MHGNEQIADGRSLWEHDSRILGLQPTCAFVSVEGTKLQVVLIKEMTTAQKQSCMFVGIEDLSRTLLATPLLATPLFSFN